MPQSLEANDFPHEPARFSEIITGQLYLYVLFYEQEMTILKVQGKQVWTVSTKELKSYMKSSKLEEAKSVTTSLSG